MAGLVLSYKKIWIKKASQQLWPAIDPVLLFKKRAVESSSIRLEEFLIGLLRWDLSGLANGLVVHLWQQILWWLKPRGQHPTAVSRRLGFGALKVISPVFILARPRGIPRKIFRI